METNGQGGWGRNWDQLLRNYSSGDDSDEYDTPNIVSFQKNVRRNAELIQSFIPHMTPEGVQAIPPMLMQDPYVMHDDLIKSNVFDSLRSSEYQEAPGHVEEKSARGEDATREEESENGKEDAEREEEEGKVERGVEEKKEGVEDGKREEASAGGILV